MHFDDWTPTLVYQSRQTTFTILPLVPCDLPDVSSFARQFQTACTFMSLLLHEFHMIKMDDMDFCSFYRIITRRTLQDVFLDFTVPSHYQNNKVRLRFRFQTITTSSNQLTLPACYLSVSNTWLRLVPWILKLRPPPLSLFTTWLTLWEFGH